MDSELLYTDAGMAQTRSKRIPTWGNGEERFWYEGSVQIGTTIHYGENFRWQAEIRASDYDKLLRHFK